MPEVDNALAHYHALVHGVGIVSLPGRGQIELSGPDRAAFLHNLCTSDVKGLLSGEGCEAFFTNLQGKTIGHGYIFAAAESLLIELAGGQTERLLAHLDRYLIMEKVTLRQRRDTEELLLAGAGAAEFLAKLGIGELPAERLAHMDAQLLGHSVRICRVDFTGPYDLLLNTSSEEVASLREQLCQAGATPCSLDAFEMARIERGTPIYGQDISDKNFPQELARDKLAISFTKGCYLGQETVARIDSMGHVNQTLCGLRFSSESVPQPGLELKAADKAVGHVTSAAFSPRLGGPLALGYVRREHKQPETLLESSLGAATVVRLPIA
jgi:folate-binding protein YgfZ